MKKLLFLLAALTMLAYFGLLPFHAEDVARLLPVETVIITRDGESYRVDVGAGVIGIGRTIRGALDALREQVTGELFYQTAEQVIVTEEAESALPEIVTEERFRPAAAIYGTPEPTLDARQISDYLRTRHTELTLGRAAAALAASEPIVLPQVVRAGGGYRILA